jgi:hypothetical protein
MFCRYCGAAIAADSVFCPKCGKRLDSAGNPRIDSIVKTLKLKTPYPYFALLLILFVSWAVWPKPKPAAYTSVKWSIEQDKVLDVPQENLYQQSFSLVLENKGNAPVRETPVDVVARIEPQKTAAIILGFLGRRLEIMQGGKALPLTIVLSDPIDPGAKRRYLLDGAITAKPPFKVTYEIREEGRPQVLASYVVEK